MSATLRIYLFGGFRLAADDKDLPPIATVRARSLFAYLAMHSRQAHTRDLLAGLFWPDLPDTLARRRLSQALWRIRQAFRAANRDAPLLVAANAIQFDSDTSYWLDVEAFEAALEGEGERESVGGRERGRGRAAGLIKEAVKLYCGDFMDGYYDDWIIPERERLRDLHLDALENLIARCKERGDYEEALRFARQLALAEPLRETAHCEIMRFCRLLDRPQEALHQYEILKDILTVELGIEPSPPVAELYRQLLTDDAQRAHRPAGQRVPTSPFLDSVFSIPLVGRGTEREKLIARLDAAMQGAGGLALVGGEAGVGKTRFLQEVARDAGWRGVQTLWGWGQDRASVPAYDILAQILRAGLTSLRATQLRDLVDDVWLSALDMIVPDSASLWPDLPAIPSLKPEQQRKQVHEAIARVVLALGQINPYFLILEDVHWATETTLAALLHLAPRLNQSRVFIILSYRTGEAQDRPTIWKMLQRLYEAGNHERFGLDRLTSAETKDLVRLGLGLGLRQSAPRFTRRVYQETGGNPLFVLETLRALHDQNLLYRDDSGGWNTPWDATTTDYAELPVPPGVHQVIARRLERLDEDKRALLNAAAILGDRFDFSLVARLVQQDRKACTKSVNLLVSRRFLEEEPSAYHFSHNLVRQVVIMEMKEAEKRRRHGVAVAVLEKTQPDQFETLAYHAAQGEIWERAFIYNRKAGDRARAVYAGKKAIEFYSHALDAWLHLEDKSSQEHLALLQSRGEVFQETGQFDLAEEDFQAVLHMALQSENWQAHAAASNSLSYLHFQRGDYDSALKVSTQAFDMASLAVSEALMARALLNSANALRNMGRAPESIDFYRRAAEALEAMDDQVRLADCLNRMGYAYIFTGQLAEAEAVMQRGLAMRRRLDDKVGLAYSLSNLSGLYVSKGDFVRAQETAVEAYEVATTAGDPYGQDAALQNLGFAHLEQGSLHEAIDLFQRAIAIAREIGDNPLVAEALADMGQAYAQKGELVKARELEQASLVCFKEGGEIWYLGRAYAYLAEISLALGDEDAAGKQARQALNIARELGSPHLLGMAHQVMGKVHGAIGNTEVDPARHFDESIRLLEAGGFRASLARALAANGRWLLVDGGAEERRRGRGMEERARSLFQELDMARDLVMLDRDDAGVTHPNPLSVRLPSVAAPTGRPLGEEEWVEVIWHVAAVEDELIPGKATRRRHRLLRLLRQASEQNAAPRVSDLARALDVSPKTIKRDLAALRAAGHHARTRGSRRRRIANPTGSIEGVGG